YMLPSLSFRTTFVAFLNTSPWAIGAFVFAMIWSLGRPFVGGALAPRGVFARYASGGLELTATLLSLLMFASAVAPLRFWPHYFLCTLPFVGLVIGLRGQTALSSGAGQPLAQSTLVVLTALGAFVAATGTQKAVEFEAQAR